MGMNHDGTDRINGRDQERRGRSWKKVQKVGKARHAKVHSPERLLNAAAHFSPPNWIMGTVGSVGVGVMAAGRPRVSTNPHRS
jgi:hypothetical protein